MHAIFFKKKIQPWIITQPRADISFLSDRTIWSPPKATMSFIGPHRHRLTAKAGHTSCIRLRADSPGHLPNTSSRVRMSDEGGGCVWNKHRRDAAGSWRHIVFKKLMSAIGCHDCCYCHPSHHSDCVHRQLPYRNPYHHRQECITMQPRLPLVTIAIVATTYRHN